MVREGLDTLRSLGNSYLEDNTGPLVQLPGADKGCSVQLFKKLRDEFEDVGFLPHTIAGAAWNLRAVAYASFLAIQKRADRAAARIFTKSRSKTDRRGDFVLSIGNQLRSEYFPLCKAHGTEEEATIRAKMLSSIRGPDNGKWYYILRSDLDGFEVFELPIVPKRKNGERVLGHLLSEVLCQGLLFGTCKNDSFSNSPRVATKYRHWRKVCQKSGIFALNYF
jgi:hypothetical protein